jgi:polysaccharide pyruvyl transferase WcaK-like protein
MILEIHGAGFTNKGAEMMLRAVTSELEARLPNFIPVIDPTYGRYEQRAALGLGSIYPLRTHVGSPLFSWRLKQQRFVAALPKNLVLSIFGREQAADLGRVTLREIEGFIDISGFAYSSHWGNKPTQDMALLTRYYRKQNKPVILLPQAFGPFETPIIRSAIREIIDNATLIFARDTESFNYLREQSASSKSIRQAPDMTLFYPKKQTPKAKKRAGAVGIVPNIRLLDRGKELWGNRYFDLLTGIISHLLRQGVPVELLVHDDSGQDLKLAERVRDRAGSRQVPIIREENPLLIKKRISEYQLIIGSRYHSLTAALSSEVPVIALGWAHKYKSLMEEFDLRDYLFQPDIPVEQAIEFVSHALEAGVNEAIRKQISKHLELKSAANQAMWDAVIQSLTSP